MSGVHAYVLVQTEIGRSASVAAEIAKLPGVESAEDVTGPYDVIARVSSDSLEALGLDVITPIQEVPGITRTLTCSVVSMA